MMIGIEEVITIVSVLIALGSLVTAIVMLTHNKGKDSKEDIKETIEIRTGLQGQIDTMSIKLESIDGGIRDLRADNRAFRSDLTRLRDELRDEIREIHDEARHGIELAEAAHRRLDRIGAEPDILVQKLQQKGKMQ